MFLSFILLILDLGHSWCLDIFLAGFVKTDCTTNCVLQDVTEVYTLGKILGKGQFGTTRLATEKATGKDFACKSIAKRKLL